MLPRDYPGMCSSPGTRAHLARATPAAAGQITLKFWGVSSAPVRGVQRYLSRNEPYTRLCGGDWQERNRPLAPFDGVMAFLSDLGAALIADREARATTRTW